MRVSVLLCFIAYSVLLFDGAHSAKILVVFPMESHSHYSLGFRLVKELANRGHQITYITPYPQKTPMKNVREISVEKNLEGLEEMKKGLFNMGQVNIIANMFFMSSMSSTMAENVLKRDTVQKFLQSNEKFDLVLMEYFANDALTGFASHFKAPLVVLSPMPAANFVNHLVGNPGPSSYVPNLLTEFTPYMTFWQRVKNTLYNDIDSVIRQNVIYRQQKAIYERYFPNGPDFNDVLYNTSLLLLNSHESINPAVPHVPNMIQIGGYHVNPPKELPKDLKDFLDSSKEGVVLFSMGSNLKSAYMPDELKKGILKAFSKIKQKVLWKFEEELPGLPANVKIMKWLPQQDILAHPNLVAFITHGGLLSTIETIYHGKPIIGIPVFGDQNMNMKSAVNSGYGLSIPFKELSEETLSKALHELLNNPKYGKEAKRRQQLMHDRETKPIDSAMYWIEYVIRHRGAPHLRSPATTMSWCHLYSIDVYGLIIAVTVATVYALYAVLRCICCRRKNTKITSKSKKNN